MRMHSIVEYFALSNIGVFVKYWRVPRIKFSAVSGFSIRLKPLWSTCSGEQLVQWSSFAENPAENLEENVRKRKRGVDPTAAAATGYIYTPVYNISKHSIFIYTPAYNGNSIYVQAQDGLCILCL